LKKGRFVWALVKLLYIRQRGQILCLNFRKKYSRFISAIPTRLLVTKINCKNITYTMVSVHFPDHHVLRGYEHGLAISCPNNRNSYNKVLRACMHDHQLVNNFLFALASDVITYNSIRFFDFCHFGWIIFCMLPKIIYIY
jgi:hypothetical protein